ncbi:MAG: hypothetical protein ACR2H5_02350, partial [Ktedonobacteraceae bacterium]
KRLSHTVQYSTFLGRLQVLPKNNSVPYIPMSLRQGAYGTYANIIEIMTSSTSGGNKDKGTTISGAFQDAILGRSHRGPDINYRQVWARMVS